MARDSEYTYAVKVVSALSRLYVRERSCEQPIPCVAAHKTQGKDEKDYVCPWAESAIMQQRKSSQQVREDAQLEGDVSTSETDWNRSQAELQVECSCAGRQIQLSEGSAGLGREQMQLIQCRQQSDCGGPWSSHACSLSFRATDP